MAARRPKSPSSKPKKPRRVLRRAGKVIGAAGVAATIGAGIANLGDIPTTASRIRSHYETEAIVRKQDLKLLAVEQKKIDAARARQQIAKNSIRGSKVRQVKKTVAELGELVNKKTAAGAAAGAGLLGAGYAAEKIRRRRKKREIAEQTPDDES